MSATADKLKNLNGVSMLLMDCAVHTRLEEMALRANNQALANSHHRKVMEQFKAAGTMLGLSFLEPVTIAEMRADLGLPEVKSA